MRNTLGQKLDGLNKIIKTEGNKELFDSILLEAFKEVKITQYDIDRRNYRNKNAV
ncbi:hypothetical protein [Clostridium perfringens]|uniref:Uncharacterized protein n=1 Tax=Clostridium perfringens TaxID=1502 RepID=A0AAP4A8S7_CLOPF|nr:hypothetical protein [Clostridium perfringens]MDH2337343.1 hypothetical protein [Clostridium perfringens]